MDKVVLLNVGNTYTREALCEDGAITVSKRHATHELLDRDVLALPAAEPDAVCLVACVVPRVMDLLATRHGPERLRALSPGMIRRVDFGMVAAATVGADRLANAAAAVATCPPPVIVLDCGTAITTEVIDGRGRFRGGAILPGRTMVRKALHQQTGQLPLIELGDELPSPLGTDTREAMLAGTDLALVGAVEKILAETRAILGVPDCPVLAVGGDAGYFQRHLPWILAGGDDFTLRGLAAIARDL